MQDWWERHGPPVYMAAAAAIGYKPPEKTSASRRKKDVEKVHWSKDLEGLMASFGGAGGAVQ